MSTALVHHLRNCPVKLGRYQAGMTLMEAMISLSLSLVVTSAMVVLMANSLGTTSRVIQMTQLSDQLRNTMSMLTRDIRRANYSANAAYCYANSDCGLDGTSPQYADIDITGNCVRFGLDRNFDGDSTNDGAGGFRLVDAGGVGAVEMWVGGSAPICGDHADWVAVTDPDFVDITVFNIGNGDSFEDSALGEDGATITAFTRHIDVQLGGELIRDETIKREIHDEIRVRNNIIVKTLGT